jgi:salicylate synthetase
MIDGTKSFEATLVLRTLFQDDDGSWIQAGAGVIGISSAEREYKETCEKFESVTPYIVARVHGRKYSGVVAGR